MSVREDVTDLQMIRGTPLGWSLTGPLLAA